MKLRSFVLAVVCTCLGVLSARATIGLAEWSVPTPGAHVVCSQDPYKSEHEVCLRTGDNPAPGTSIQVLISKIEWWQYHAGWVVGKCARGWFLFDEKGRRVRYVDTEVALRTDVKALPKPKPLTRRITAEDGWKLANGPFMRALIAKHKASPDYQKLSSEERAAVDKEAERLRPPDLRPLPE